LKEGSCEVSLGLCRRKGSGDEEGISNYINYMMTQIWIKYINVKRLKSAGHVV
jgi:hypothetical protein